MNVFISWSGERSRDIGEVLKNWLQDVLQAVKPYFTPDDIEKGQKWNAEISAKLESSQFGLVCITPENASAPWLMFESGAISKLPDARLCPVLFGMEPAQMVGPLVHFQATPFSKMEMGKFVNDLNKKCPDPLTEAQVNRAFERLWPELDEKIQKIIARQTTQTKTKTRTTEEMLEETLGIVRTIATQNENIRSLNFRSEIEPSVMANKMIRTLLRYASECLEVSMGANQLAQHGQLKRLHTFFDESAQIILSDLPNSSRHNLLQQFSNISHHIRKRIDEISMEMGEELTEEYSANELERPAGLTSRRYKHTP